MEKKSANKSQQKKKIREQNLRTNEDKRLDEQLKETFPASDPITKY